METIDDIAAEMCKDIPRVVDAKVILRNYADRIEAAHKSYNREVVELLKDVIAGVCLHCDMQSACQEGEDGMSTNCNAVAKAKHFIEQHTEPELNNDELPF
jgi:hypothetical protein